MVVEINRQSDIFPQELATEFPAGTEHLLDIEVVVQLLFRAIAAMSSVHRTEVVPLAGTLGTFIVEHLDDVSPMLDLLAGFWSHSGVR
jgi:hypothetical protein